MYGYTVKLLIHSFKSQYLLSDIIKCFVSNILSVCMHHYNLKVLSIFVNINNYYPVILLPAIVSDFVPNQHRNSVTVYVYYDISVTYRYPDNNG